MKRNTFSGSVTQLKRREICPWVPNLFRRSDRRVESYRFLEFSTPSPVSIQLTRMQKSAADAMEFEMQIEHEPTIVFMT
ncbi:hypothetical protein CEXT_384401 [Caerostris extrusa]|uniref:Uncharacterized protein n=1 Tax=Caerostris extrusa TaxID=172846 RepID=A0AAV4VN32_CAEEX|nr:hypothetical protein CEXT_384401 [Caerostris extrusa]